MVSVALFVLFIGWPLCLLLGWIFDDEPNITGKNGLLTWLGTIFGIGIAAILCAAFVIILFH